QGRGVLGVAPVLHRQDQDRGHRRPRREVQAPLHQEDEVTSGAMPPRLTLPPFVLPPSAAALALIALAFVLPGLVGHDPWKTHDAIGIGIAHGMVSSGDGVVPRVAGMPWLYDPPLFHWLAVACGTLLSFFIEFHSGARIAAGAVVLAAFYLIYLAARDWNGGERKREAGSAAFLLLLG